MLNKFLLAGEPTQNIDSLGIPSDSPTKGTIQNLIETSG